MTQRRRTLTQWLLVWHRRIGLVVAVLVLLLSLTGLLLNHSARLGLDDRSVQADWLLEWYGFPPVGQVVSYRVANHWISWVGSRLYLDETPVAEAAEAPVGAAPAGDGILAVGFPDELLLLAPNGEVIERMGAEALPGRLTDVGTTAEGALAVATDDGRFAADQDLLEWTPAGAAAQWSEPVATPPALREPLLQAQRGPGLPAERVLLDLHSGRLFGPWGPFVMDAAAIAFLVLTATGIVNWWRRRQARATWAAQAKQKVAE
jgi:hypothetical protein